MKAFRYISLIIITTILMLFSCEPNAEDNIQLVKKQLVVEAWIENGNYARVILTYNSPYFSNLDSSAFRSLIASRAKVIVTDGIKSEILTFTRDTNYFSLFLYKGNELKGEAGKKYTLIIEDEIDTIHAQTTIPFPVKLDSAWYSSTSDTSGVIKGIIQDNPAERNYYRVFTKIRNKDKNYIPTLIATYEDLYFNGKKFTFSLNKGPASYLEPSEDVEFHSGDTVLLKLTSIDVNSYDFWFSYDQEILNTANPFASNFKSIKSNINGGLGIWCGYGASYNVIIVP